MKRRRGGEEESEDGGGNDERDESGDDDEGEEGGWDDCDYDKESYLPPSDVNQKVILVFSIKEAKVRIRATT